MGYCSQDTGETSGCSLLGRRWGGGRVCCMVCFILVNHRSWNYWCVESGV